MTSHYQLHRSFVHADSWLELCNSLFEDEELAPFQEEAGALVPLEVARLVLQDEAEALELPELDGALEMQDEARALIPQEDNKAVVPYLEKKGYDVDISQWITHDHQGRILKPEAHRDDVKQVFECVVNSETYECVVGPKMYQMNQELQIVYDVDVGPPNGEGDAAGAQFEKEVAPTLYLTIINPNQGEINPRGVQITELENNQEEENTQIDHGEIALEEDFERIVNQGEYAFQVQQREMSPVMYQGVVASQTEMVPQFYQGEITNQVYQGEILPQVYQEKVFLLYFREKWYLKFIKEKYPVNISWRNNTSGVSGRNCPSNTSISGRNGTCNISRASKPSILSGKHGTFIISRRTGQSNVL